MHFVQPRESPWHFTRYVRSTKQIFKIGGENWGGQGRHCSGGLDFYEAQLWRFTDRIRGFLVTSQMLVVRKKGPSGAPKRLAQPNAQQLSAIFVVLANQGA